MFFLFTWLASDAPAHLPATRGSPHERHPVVCALTVAALALVAAVTFYVQFLI
jgi:hypothetical protein